MGYSILHQLYIFDISKNKSPIALVGVYTTETNELCTSDICISYINGGTKSQITLFTSIHSLNN